MSDTWDSGRMSHFRDARNFENVQAVLDALEKDFQPVR